VLFLYTASPRDPFVRGHHRAEQQQRHDDLPGKLRGSQGQAKPSRAGSPMAAIHRRLFFIISRLTSVGFILVSGWFV
jgi:hypothetical protein